MMKFTILTIIIGLLTGCVEEKSPTMLSPIINKPKEKTYVICSPIRGVLTYKGVPLANTKITRQLKWNSSQEVLVEHFKTDDAGNFYLPLHNEVLKISPLAEFRANQRISVELDGNSHDIWGSSHSGSLFGETGGVEVDSVKCELSDEFLPVYGENISLLSTKCRWENINLEYDDNE